MISYDDLTSYGWQSACHVEFNPEGSMLMVSGILMGDISGRIKGEIIVFTLKNQKLRICARISNRVDAFVEIRNLKDKPKGKTTAFQNFFNTVHFIYLLFMFFMQYMLFFMNRRGLKVVLTYRYSVFHT